jgi:hypothetical protein
MGGSELPALQATQPSGFLIDPLLVTFLGLELLRPDRGSEQLVTQGTAPLLARRTVTSGGY